jgi:hypothetical protein
MSTSVEVNFDTCRELATASKAEAEIYEARRSAIGRYIEKVGLRVTRYLSRIDAQLLHA